MADWGTPLITLFNNIYDSVTESLSVKLNPEALSLPDEYALKATGADAYAKVITPTEDKSHLLIYNSGTHGAVISLDAGTTDHIPVPGQSTLTLDYIRIEGGVEIHAKNLTPGSNFTNLYLMVW